ncbi:DoxX family protein [Neorhizobium alkalisoli]|uniref:Putative membrane protein n=1 Tax=Neorhizobium alkalisoli TaxID=528178 RepID=A0A561QBC1_9HYPH|nr:DoxX family protein [Neorhizobium alkalisoli]TWF47637.1 putative membrane protein [Neorhizobium alkalisoli]
MTERIDVWRTRLTILLAFVFGVGGVLHLLIPKPFLSITPEWVPFPGAVIMLTGLCEIAGAAGLLVPRLRRMAGLGLALYALCVFPANIKHASDSLGGPDPSLWQWFYHFVRLPLQPVIVWAALFTGRAVAWPFAAGSGKAGP